MVLSHWGEADEIVAHALGIKINATEMQAMMLCTCQPALLGGWCSLCGRRRATERFLLGEQRFEPYEGTL